jgi:hypothetical protein
LGGSDTLVSLNLEPAGMSGYRGPIAGRLATDRGVDCVAFVSQHVTLIGESVANIGLVLAVRGDEVAAFLGPGVLGSPARCRAVKAPGRSLALRPSAFGVLVEGAVDLRQSVSRVGWDAGWIDTGGQPIGVASVCNDVPRIGELITLVRESTTTVVDHRSRPFVVRPLR